MGLPQLVGLPCVCCHKVVASVSEGLFCPDCGNPVHRDCLPQDAAAGEAGRCATCGGDLQNPVAVEVRTEREPEATQRSRILVCPNCGSRSGFRPFRGDESLRRERAIAVGLPFFCLLGPIVLLFFWVFGSATAGQVQCVQCDYVFRPWSRLREIGCIVLLILGSCGLLALAILPRL
jgi:hypothetical protein